LSPPRWGIHDTAADADHSAGSVCLNLVRRMIERDPARHELRLTIKSLGDWVTTVE
jgi:hypothetical protein